MGVNIKCKIKVQNVIGMIIECVPNVTTHKTSSTNYTELPQKVPITLYYNLHSSKATQQQKDQHTQAACTLSEQKCAV